MHRIPGTHNKLLFTKFCLPIRLVTLCLVLGMPNLGSTSDANLGNKQFQVLVDKINRGPVLNLDTSAFLADFKNHINQNPGEPSWLQAAGTVYYQIGQFDKARRALYQLKRPTSKDDRLLALSLFELKEFRKSLAYFNRLPDLRTNRNDWEIFCQALSKGGTKVDATREWESFRSRYAGMDIEGKNAGLEFLAMAYRKPLQKEKLVPILEQLLKKYKGKEEEANLLLETATLYGETHLKAMEMLEQYQRLRPDDFSAARELASIYEGRQEFSKAIKLYLQVAPRFTNDFKFNRHLAEILAKTESASKNNREQSLLFYETCRTLAPNDFEVPLAMGKLQEDLHQPDLAMESYKAVLELNPTHSQAKEKMLALISTSKIAGPWLKTMMENEKKNPKDHTLQYKLAKLCLASHDRDNAYKYLQKALQNSNDREEYALLLSGTISNDAQIMKNFSLLQKMSLKSETPAEILVLVGRGYSLYHNPNKAAETYSRVLQMNPKLLDKQRQPILDLFAQKKYSDALFLAERYLMGEPKDIDIHRIFVSALSETNSNPPKIRAAIQTLTSLDPLDEKWYLRLAELDLAAKDSAAALKHGYEWIKMHPEDKKGLVFLEPLAAKAKNGEIYLQTLDYLARLEPVNQNQCDLKIAYFLFETEKFSQATEGLSKLTSYFSNDAQFWNRFGQSQIKIGREGAELALAKAYQLEPGNVEYARHYGAALKSDEELKLNVELFRVLNRSHPNKEERRKLAHALFLIGNYGASAQEWDWFLTQDPQIAIIDSTAGMAFLKSGQLSKAKSILEKRLVAQPRDLGLLATLSDLYEREGETKKRIVVMEKLVQEDQRMGDFVLRLAKEKEKAGLETEALSLYSQWSFRHQEDASSLKSYYTLAEKQKDTTALIEALRLLVQNKGQDRRYRFQLAEIYFARSGELKEIEELVKSNPDYTQGKKILISEYHSKQTWDQLASLEGFLVSESSTNSDLLEALGDLLAHQKRIKEANQAYYSWLAVRRKDREIFEKVYTYAKENQGANLIPILKMGSESFPEDLDLKLNLAASLGNTRSALEVYEQAIAKRPKDIDAVSQAAEISKAIGDRAALARWSKRWTELKPDEEKPWQYLIEALNPLTEKSPLADAMEGLQRIIPGNFELVVQLAHLHEDLKHFESAVSFYRKGLYLDPKNKSVRDRLISLMKAQSKKEDLADVLTEIQNIDSSAHEAQFELAKLYLQKQDKEKAFAYLITALQQNALNQNYQRLLPKVIHNRQQIQKYFKALVDLASRPETSTSDRNNTDLFLHLGKGYAYQGLWEESARALSLVYQLDAQKLLGDRDLIIACYKGKQLALAAELAEKYFEKTVDFDKEIRQIQILSYEKTMKDPALIRKTLQLLLALDKDNAGAQLRLAELDLKARDTLAAINNIRNCLTTNPNELRAYKMMLPLITKRSNEQRVTYLVVLEKLSILDSAHKATHLVELANFYFQKNNYRQTARLLSQVVELQPNDANSWFRLGQCRSHLQVGDLGVECFRHAWELQPSHLPFAHTFAQALGTPEQFQANLKLFQFTEDRDPSIHERKGLAMAYFYNADYNNSAKAWEKVLGEKTFEGKYIGEAALAFIKTKQYGKALPLFELRLAREPQDLGLLDTLYTLYTKTGDEKNRIGMLEGALLVDPSYKDFQLQLGQAKLKLLDTLSAIEHYGFWTSNNTNDVEALKTLHRLAMATQDTASLEMALKLLVKSKNFDLIYAFQLAEIQYKFSGNPTAIENLVKNHDDYQRGKIILAKDYFRKSELTKMIPFEKALATESLKDPELLGSLAELYAYQNKTIPANKAFRDNFVFMAEKHKPNPAHLALELRSSFEKAWIYGEANKSPYQTEVLEIGNRLFPHESPIQHALALSFGKDSRALELYKLILEKDGNDLVALKRACELAMTLSKIPEAITWLEQWARLEPGTIQVWQLLAEAYTQLKLPLKTAEALEHQTYISPADASLAFKTGKAFQIAKNNEKALEYFIRASELKPKDPSYAFEVLDLLQNMTQAFLSQGQTAKAMELFGLLLERDPKNKKANLYIGMWLAENHDFTSAVNMLKAGIDQSSEPNPILAKAWRLLGASLAQSNENQASLEAYKRALNLDPLDKVAAMARLELTKTLDLKAEIPLALAQVIQLDSSRIEELLQLAPYYVKDGNFVPATALYRLATVALDSSAEIWGLYGEALEGSKRNKDALVAWEKAFRLGDRTPYNLYGIARLHHEAGTLDKAESALQELVVLQPENDEANAWLAELALNKNDLILAEELFVQAAQLAPDKIEYTQGLAEVYLRRGDIESVLEILEPVRARLNFEGRLTYADGLRLAGQLEEALPFYREINNKSPSLRATIGLAELQINWNKPEEAIQSIAQSVYQNESEVKLQLGKAYLALNELGKAVQILERLVLESKSNPNYLLALAQVHFQQKLYPQALKEFSSALHQQADLAPAAFGVGMVLIATGQINQGKNYFYPLVQGLSKNEKVLGLRGLAAAALAEKKDEEAAEHLSKAVEISPTTEALNELSSVSLKLGRNKAMEGYINTTKK